MCVPWMKSPILASVDPMLGSRLDLGPCWRVTLKNKQVFLARSSAVWLVSVLGGAMCLAFERGAAARCGGAWVPSEPTPLGMVQAMVVLPDGDLVVAGSFTHVGTVAANNIARRDAQTGDWSALGQGLGWEQHAIVHSLVLMPNGDIVAGGRFSMAGGRETYCIARWNATQWSSLSDEMNGYTVYALASLPNGDLIAGGDFTSAGGTSAGGVARWDGVAWHALGSGVDGPVCSLLVLPTGGLLVGGSFAAAGDVVVNSIARWDGTAWSPLGLGLASNVFNLSTRINALALLPNGDVVAAGHFYVDTGEALLRRIARWNGHDWVPMELGLNGSVHALATLGTGEVVVGGVFGNGAFHNPNRVARWDGASWQPFGSGVSGGGVHSLAVLPSGDLVAGGSFTSAGGLKAHNLATYFMDGQCCPADLDNDGDVTNGFTRDDAVTVEDLLSFLGGYEQGLIAVDLDNNGEFNVGTPDGAVTIDDLLFFLARLERGC
jgi:Domain of unknown function (DUF5122) beta-propeller